MVHIGYYYCIMSVKECHGSYWIRHSITIRWLLRFGMWNITFIKLMDLPGYAVILAFSLIHCGSPWLCSNSITIGIFVCHNVFQYSSWYYMNNTNNIVHREITRVFKFMPDTLVNIVCFLTFQVEYFLKYWSDFTGLYAKGTGGDYKRDFYQLWLISDNFIWNPYKVDRNFPKT